MGMGFNMGSLGSIVKSTSIIKGIGIQVLGEMRTVDVLLGIAANAPIIILT
jgi:hypothetical protein